MTAVVGILNKQAVAIAADSAVTVSSTNGRKIFNKANKVFTLSKRHPIGIMLYNSATFMLTPWETIIKVYRKQLGDKSFQSVKDYQYDFIEFLRSKDFYTDEATQKLFLRQFASTIIQGITEEVVSGHSHLFDTRDPSNQSLILEIFEKYFDSYIIQFDNPADFSPEFIDYSFETFEKYSFAIFDFIIKELFVKNGFSVSEPFMKKIKTLVFVLLKSKKYTPIYTGLIFTGFGESEIYPQLIPINISMVVDSRLRYFVNTENQASITMAKPSAVRPFAQKDVIETILSGVDPALDQIYLTNFSSLFEKYNKTILESIPDKESLLYKQIMSLNTDSIVQEFRRLNKEIKRKKYVKPLMAAVSNLDKEDLAEMAESLIYLTYLKRRITFAEESVGGPVDVAVISKGDGFIWIKRKHYFKPELNQHFFDNYFK